MPIILSSKVDVESDYDDILFEKYHYPKSYRNQIRSGDKFIYYQGDRRKKTNRYYFGFGIIGKIECSSDGEYFYAYILNGRLFQNKVPIYDPKGGYYESTNYSSVRQKEIPAWRNSIRKLSNEAFDKIMELSGINYLDILDMSEIEFKENPIEIIENLNEKYEGYEAIKKNKIVKQYIDRGQNVTNSLKKILGWKCQICKWEGFIKNNKEGYIEAHHLDQIAFKNPNSLCSDNIILVCPNCHREIHYGSAVTISDRGDEIYIKLSNREAIMRKNTIEYLKSI